jgi:hypothetical protein
MAAKRKRGNPALQEFPAKRGRPAWSPSPPVKIERAKEPQKETITIHTTRERQRNAEAAADAAGGVFNHPRTNKLLLAGGAAAGGAATLMIAEKAGLSPSYAGLATGGLALLGTALFPSPQMKDAFFAAGLGATGVAGVQLLAGLMAKKAASNQAAPAKRQADGDSAQPYITRGELNDALANLADKNADQHKQTCDLMTVLHDEIRKVMREPQPAARDPQSVAPSSSVPPWAAPSPASSGAASSQSARPSPYLYPLQSATPPTRDSAGEDDYMRNAYGDEWERNAADEARDANPDEYERNAYGDEYERNAYVDDERNAYVDDERNAYVDDERNAYVDDERNAYVDDAA